MNNSTIKIKLRELRKESVNINEKAKSLFAGKMARVVRGHAGYGGIPPVVHNDDCFEPNEIQICSNGNYYVSDGDYHNFGAFLDEIEFIDKKNGGKPKFRED